MSVNRLQMSFREVGKGPIRDKNHECYHCGKLPEKGQHFPWCSACKNAVYCSKKYQKDAWKIHKYLCEFTKANTEVRRLNERLGLGLRGLGLRPGYPSASERINLLEDFIEAHSAPFRNHAIYSAMYMRGGPAGERNFDFAKESMVYHIRYRVDCEGNPALAFRVVGGGFELTQELLKDPFLRTSWEAGRKMREEEDKKQSAADPEFLGTVMMLFRTEDVQYWYPQPWWVTDEDSVQAKSDEHPHWLEELKQTVEAGHVLRQVGNDEWRWGYMRKSGPRWKWEELPSEDMAQIGNLVE